MSWSLNSLGFFTSLKSPVPILQYTSVCIGTHVGLLVCFLPLNFFLYARAFMHVYVCTVCSADELVLTELIFNGAFNDLSVEQVTALLSCFVYDEKSVSSQWLPGVEVMDAENQCAGCVCVFMQRYVWTCSLSCFALVVTVCTLTCIWLCAPRYI